MALVRGRRQLSLHLPLPPKRHVAPPPPATWTSSSAATWPSLSDLERLDVLGHGNGGTVYKVRHRKTGNFYALKLVRSPPAAASAADRRRAARERDILLRTSDSPHVVQCHAIFEQQSNTSSSSSNSNGSSSYSSAGGEVVVLMEYMEGGTLETVLRSSGPFHESLLASVARQVLSGLAHLHSRKIIHRDIKPSNLLVGSAGQGGDFVVKIADFGVSKMVCRSLESCNSYVGTCAYMSPERFDPEAYGGNYDGYAGDVWSLGLTLMELFLGHFPLLPPGQRPDWATLMCAICFGDAPAAPEGASDLFRDFLDCCLQKDSAKRWSASQLLNHSFLSLSASS